MATLQFHVAYRQDLSDGRRPKSPHWHKTSGYVSLCALLFCVWAASYPLWEPFITSVLKARDVSLVMDLATLFMPCYVFFVLDSLMKSVFYALGETLYLVVISGLVNALLVVLYLLFIFGALPNTVLAVAGIFGAGLVVGFFVTVPFYARLLKKVGMML